MIYRTFQGEKISQFGMGCMRLPKTNPADDGSVDVEHATRMVDFAYENGCTYFDTAWGYHNGRSESIIGEALSKYPRESFQLATKFPGYDPSNWGKVEEIFEEQLRKCQVDYFDFYLFHNVCEMNIDAYLDDEKYGIHRYLMEQKRNGRIKHLGFSVHGAGTVMDRFCEAYGQDMEFTQIQLNYVDYKFQDAKHKLDVAAQYNLPVIVMEPLRGGMLAKATPEEEALMRAARPDESVVGWALRYLQTQDQVFTVLCGSSSLEQMQENMAIFAEDKPLSAGELAVLDGIVEKRITAGLAPCTACHYCVSHCPQELDIPRLLELYNEHKFTGGGFIAPMALAIMGEDKQPSSCIGCGACSVVCPQQIDIPGMLEAFADML